MYFKNPDPVVRIFAGIVERMNEELLEQFQAIDSNIEAINYQHGHPMEIVETLAQYDEAEGFKYRKYPLVLLVEDIKEHHGNADGRFAELDLRIFLINHTKPDYKSEERYEKNFDPFLFPMYQSLMNNIYRDPHFLIPDVYSIDHIKYNRLYWGKESLKGNTENALNDHIDAIEIQSMKITQDLHYCTYPISPNI